MCLCSSCSKPKQQYNYPTQDSCENNVLGITAATTEAQTFKSESELSRLNITDICADCHALRPTEQLHCSEISAEQPGQPSPTTLLAVRCAS